MRPPDTRNPAVGDDRACGTLCRAGKPLIPPDYSASETIASGGAGAQA